VSVYFNLAPCHGGILGVKVQIHAFFDFGTRWRWVISFTSRSLYPREGAPGTHWIGGWVGPRAVLDAVVKRKIPRPRRESNPRTPIVQPVAWRYTDWAMFTKLFWRPPLKLCQMSSGAGCRFFFFQRERSLKCLTVHSPLSKPETAICYD
jgi:hypothetical protein